MAGLALGLTAVLVGCSGSGGESASSDSAGSATLEDMADRPDAAQGADREAASGDGKMGAPGLDVAGRTGGTVSRPTVSTRAVIRKGEVSLVTKEMNRARLEIDDLIGRHGGYLASEDTSNDRKGRPERSVLTLRVPEPAFDTVMGDLVEIGRTQRADRRSEDVTTQVIDVDSRVATQEASLARLQGFLREATNVDDMIRLESEISSRMASLESLKAQQKYLRDNTAMSTITVRLHTPVPPPPVEPPEESGFLVGLADGWSALQAVLVGGATVLGAMLPFLVTAALVGVPLWLLVRTARRRRPAPLSPPTPDPS